MVPGQFTNHLAPKPPILFPDLNWYAFTRKPLFTPMRIDETPTTQQFKKNHMRLNALAEARLIKDLEWGWSKT